MQSFTEIPPSRTLSDSLSEILNNDKTALSNSSGTAFPTTNLQVGMLCCRTDQSKLYQLTSASPITWRYVANLSSDIDAQFNAKLNASAYTAADVLAKVASVDGTGSGLDADLLDGQHASAFAPSSHHHDSAYPTKTGGGASGTWAINISGQAATAALATAANAANQKWTSASLSGNVLTSNQVSAEIRNNGGNGDGDVAAMSFHCQGAYGIHLHLRADGYFGLGGWSSSSWRWYSTPGGDMVASGNVVAYSDPRLKENITPIENALQKVLQLTGVRFTWAKREFLGRAGLPDLGVLSTQVQAVVPEAVSASAFTAVEGDSYQAVAYHKLVPLLIEALREIKAEVDTLRSELASHRRAP